MILAVVGSRDFDDYSLLYSILNSYSISKIISGGALGTDTLAIRYACKCNIDYKEYLADWNRYGKRAGMLRNKDIVDNSDKVIAFWDGKSKGTLNSINRARKSGKLLRIVYFNKESTINDIF